MFWWENKKNSLHILLLSGGILQGLLEVHFEIIEVWVKRVKFVTYICNI